MGFTECEAPMFDPLYLDVFDLPFQQSIDILQMRADIALVKPPDDSSGLYSSSFSPLIPLRLPLPVRHRP